MGLPSPLDVRHYLDIRDTTVASVAEIGHGPHPITSTLPPGATYVGYDAYDPARTPRKIEQAVQHISGSEPNSSISFERLKSREVPRADRQFDEVFLSNVLGDPNVTAVQGLPQRILSAAAELATPEGMIIVRETYSPYVAFMGHLGILRILFPKGSEGLYQRRRAKMLDAAGLAIRAGVSASSDSELWERLESIYNPDNVTHPSPLEHKFYLFLGKITRG